MSVVVQFTRNGRPTGRPATPALGYNDVHFKFKRGDKKTPRFRFTKNGKTFGKPYDAPDNARDVGVEFHVNDDDSVSIRDTHWTDEKGKVIGGIDGYIAPPKGANDWHFEVFGGEITEARWTSDGYFDNESIPIPVDVNDVHVGPGGPRSRGGGRDPGSRNGDSEDRQCQLADDLEAVSQRFSVLSDVLESSRGVLREHEVGEFDGRLEEVHREEQASTRGKPPDDLYEELKKLAEKILRLGKRKSYENKYPWRYQIRLDLLVPILVEILLILRKLYRRSIPRRGPTS